MHIVHCNRHRCFNFFDTFYASWTSIWSDASAKGNEWIIFSCFFFLLSFYHFVRDILFLGGFVPIFCCCCCVFYCRFRLVLVLRENCLSRIHEDHINSMCIEQFLNIQHSTLETNELMPRTKAERQKKKPDRFHNLRFAIYEQCGVVISIFSFWIQI